MDPWVEEREVFVEERTWVRLENTLVQILVAVVITKLEHFELKLKMVSDEEHFDPSESILKDSLNTIKSAMDYMVSSLFM